MGNLLAAVQAALSGTGSAALVAAFVWGIFSVLLSPCSLVSIPLVVGYIQGQEEKGTKNALLVSGAFSLGILVNIALVGMVIASAGALMQGLSSAMNYIVSAVLFVFGLHLLDVITIPWFVSGNVKAGNKKGLLGALALGTVSGMALGPCTFAYMAPMLVIAMKASTDSLARGASIVTLYGLGYALVILLAGTFANGLDRYMNWTDNSKGPFVISQICGWLVVAAGAYFLYVA
ncbi:MULTISPECIES: cytochrome c biogenesis CcdA family protein [Dethiosulfovibrio]|uniref:Cytochrome c biogenesis protein CcdA n=2 Tax=Dethiosulfovibrio TaxID=47054 RepID=A0ABS9ERD5_9BACT|nr:MULTISPECIES: cytochrome c biogenesis protein CcdA [Dethiosulfovibrio]MCF4114098.1 cytochrome c biogenesis protein CcdA [Dethiosulfovibrio russensis]MCF4142712.1 cytochrome c biogenesis protein CcdA [Dethiosulfovibrio marinus]MCF4144724.1 cytochrome c biogenesis protein CcdA [Dethiosulfovibrio acidaminovorans]MEA3284989.1 cytochrome c biogenesis protein CcdA [Synergistota bacterium]